MKKIEGKGILSLLFFCICFCSCEKEGLQEKTRQLYIQLSMPESIHVETKGTGDTKPVLGGVEVQNVWIVQFKVNDDDNKSTGSCLKALYVPQSGISKSTDENQDGLIVNLKTGGDTDISKFTADNSLFYVIANGSRAMLTNEGSDDAMYSLTAEELAKITESDLKAKTVPIGTSGKPFVTTSPKLLTSEPFYYTPTNEGVIKVRAQMFRTFAKIKVNITSVSPGLFALDETSGDATVKIYNLPQNMATYRAAGTNEKTYPTTVDVVKGAFNMTVDQITSPNQTVSREFYMAENLRGIGKSATQQGKNQKENGPGSESDKLAGCTYIELAGIYKYDPSHTDGVKVKYTFYLGGNFTNDYNIARDYSYDITFRIAGPNSADVRVEITDGNVAIFDEVDVIKNIIVDF